jgi:hypothetical protein
MDSGQLAYTHKGSDKESNKGGDSHERNGRRDRISKRGDRGISNGGGIVEKVLVSLPKGVMQILDQELKGKIGTKYSEIIRNIVIAYLSEKGYLDRSVEVDG